jgi:hypothetical protein
LRDALAETSTTRRTHRGTAWCPPCPSGAAAAEARQVTSIDPFAAALFGPPERAPDAAETLAVAIEKRGDAGGYLDPAAAAGWTARWYRAVTEPGESMRLYLIMSGSARWTGR